MIAVAIEKDRDVVAALARSPWNEARNRSSARECVGRCWLFLSRVHARTPRIARRDKASRVPIASAFCVPLLRVRARLLRRATPVRNALRVTYLSLQQRTVGPGRAGSQIPFPFDAKLDSILSYDQPPSLSVLNAARCEQIYFREWRKWGQRSIFSPCPINIQFFFKYIHIILFIFHLI